MPRKKKGEPSLPLVTPEQPTRLRLLSVQVKNVLGIDERSLDAEGRAIVVSGANATGKSSLLQAVQAALGGGNLAKLARVGADEDPEVVLVLGGPGGDYRVEKKGKETARVLQRVGDSQAFADVARPQEFLSGLFDPRVANPVAWLLAKPKDQAILLLEALPLEMSEDELREALGDAVEKYLRPIPKGLHPLEELAMIRGFLFDARTGVNRDAKAKAGSAEQLRRELPAKAPENPAAAIAAAEEKIRRTEEDVTRRSEKAEHEHARLRIEAQGARDRGALEAKQQLNRAIAERAAAFETRAAQQRAEVERQIAREKIELDQKDEQERAVAEATVEGYDVILTQAREQLDGEKHAEEQAIAEIQSALSDERIALMGLRGQAENAVQFKALDGQATEFEAQAEEHEAESKRITESIDRLDAFRRTLAKELPIPGLEVEGSEIRLGGVPLAQVNESTRVEVAAKVAQARAERNPLKLVFLDGLERLDTKHREALLTYLVERDVQAIGAVVTDGKPAVNYIGAVSE